MSDQNQKPESYKDLFVWQKGIVLVKQIYDVTRTFPDEERFGLMSQLRRAAVSIPSNIAEGQARHTTKEFIRFVSNAEGSTAELETQLIISGELNYIDKQRIASLFSLVTEERKMLNALRRTLKERLRKRKTNSQSPT